MIIMVMGVTGCGKTTVGSLLSERLGCGFSDADGFHPAANVEKMRVGIPLVDEDRWPWLAALRQAIDDWQAAGKSHVFACSALKNAYREILSPKRDVIFVFLKGSADVIRPRLLARQGHYMNPALLESQFNTLEEPSDALTIDIDQTPDEIVEATLARLAEHLGESERQLLMALLANNDKEKAEKAPSLS